LGRLGEAAVAAHYERDGFRVLARNLRTTGGEIDLLVCRRGLLVGVEVKTRRAHGAPERLVAAADVDRRARVLRVLARAFLPSERRLHLRMDVAAVRWLEASGPEVRVFSGPERSLP